MRMLRSQAFARSKTFRNLPTFVSVFALGLVLAVASVAQAPLARLSGTVRDQNAAAIAGAAVVARNLANNVERSVITGPDGTFVLPFLAASDYSVLIRLAGF